MHVMLDIFKIFVPDDYQTWFETMCAEFPTRLSRLFREPNWRGLAINERKDPLTVSGVGLFMVMVFQPAVGNDCVSLTLPHPACGLFRNKQLLHLLHVNQKYR